LGQNFVLELHDEVSRELFVGLEQDTHEFSGNELQVELVGVLLLDHGEVFFVPLVILVFLFVVLGGLVVL